MTTGGQWNPGGQWQPGPGETGRPGGDPAPGTWSWGQPPPGDPPVAPAAPRRRRGPLGWVTRRRRLALAGVLLVLLGVLALGASAGWAARSVADPPTAAESTVQVVQAPRGDDAGVVVLPDVRGLDVLVAQQAIADAGLGADAVELVETPSALPAGTVVGQDPVGGTSGADQVTLSVAVAGALPELVGTDGSDAVQTLVELGVDVGVTQVYDPAATEGVVLAVDPPAGSPLDGAVTVTVAGPAASLFLADLTADNGCSTGEHQVNGTEYQHALSCSASTTPRTTTYLLDRRTAQLTGVVGVGDTGDPGYTATVTIRGDGVVLFTTQVGYGAAVPFTVATTGVLRLDVEYVRPATTGSGSAPDGAVVLGDPRVVGAPADIDLLDEQ